ncbi:CRISPR-associated endonuclease Cas2 [Nitratiruptor tergarcus]|uniref:CRISPR-associated endoribonuclease Cas2 n=1 Tax=Nitratiruptor tergarcus DSM 16512 TaxID=1069081 RepID=A0A1W1WSB0_9BACT|nr:CRISPR-associated endonuclease Cas2 [Nitratiruptor tergarcus]SMC09208.1 CRISPR-associated protein Cas2 [Nitratiruptor tergarcus DSM 16512]
MKRSDYLICYDISNPKRLRKIAKLLEQECIRIQYSIFLAKKATKEEIYAIADKLTELIDPDEDDVRIYKIKDHGIYMGVAYDLKEIFLIR